jgi:nucleotide-binding universal stress UspA family protein
MYRRILVPLEHSAYDVCILDHVRSLARLCNSSLVLIHVADGWAARNIPQLQLQESEEMRRDRDYLDRLCETLSGEGFDTEAVLASGDPPAEIAAAADREHCDLIAMSTHGHRFLADMLYGSVANAVRHRSTVPELRVRGSARVDTARAEAARGGPPPTTNLP